MAETKNYLTHSLENGTVQISDEVITSIAALAVRDVEGVYGLSLGTKVDLANILNKSNLRKGIRVELSEQSLRISCNLIVMAGENVMTVARNVQEGIANEVEAVGGIRPTEVNVTVCGVAVPKQK